SSAQPVRHVIAHRLTDRNRTEAMLPPRHRAHWRSEREPRTLHFEAVREPRTGHGRPVANGGTRSFERGLGLVTTASVAAAPPCLSLPSNEFSGGTTSPEGGLEGSAQGPPTGDGAGPAATPPDGGIASGPGDAGFCASFEAAAYVFCDDFDQPGRTT